jgi:hypothetical protein
VTWEATLSIRILSPPDRASLARQASVASR